MWVDAAVADPGFLSVAAVRVASLPADMVVRTVFGVAGLADENLFLVAVAGADAGLTVCVGEVFAVGRTSLCGCATAVGVRGCLLASLVVYGDSAFVRSSASVRADADALLSQFRAAFFGCASCSS